MKINKGVQEEEEEEETNFAVVVNRRRRLHSVPKSKKTRDGEPQSKVTGIVVAQILKGKKQR